MEICAAGIHMDDRKVDLARWYVSRAYSEIRNAKRYARLFQVEALIHACEAIEFSTKAICNFLDVEYEHKRHFLDSKAVVQLAEKMAEEGFGNEVKAKVLQTIPIILGYTNDIREVMRYGVDKDGALASPNKLFERNYFDTIIGHANLFCELLNKVEITRRLRIGVLNGYVTRSDDENPCKPGFASEGSAYWVECLSKLSSDINPVEIEACQINSEFALIVNPFGEHYPEIDPDRRLVFQQIKDYVEDGGIYVNCAGYPFFYAWDVSIPDDKKAPIPICEDKIALPYRSVLRTNYARPELPRFQLFLTWTGTVLYKEFKVMPTGGDPTKVKIYQSDEDKEKFGDLTQIVKEVTEFRALSEKASGVIPLIRARREDAEAYPICAFPYNRGYLLLCGMSTTEKSDYELIVNAIDAFLKWVRKTR